MTIVQHTVTNAMRIFPRINLNAKPVAVVPFVVSVSAQRKTTRMRMRWKSDE
jgi:hypothetical protein